MGRIVHEEIRFRDKMGLTSWDGVHQLGCCISAFLYQQAMRIWALPDAVILTEMRLQTATNFHRYDAGSYVPPPNLCDSSNRYYEMDPNFFLLSFSTHIFVPRDEATLFSPSHHLVKEIQCEKVTYIDIILLIQRNSAPPRMYKTL